MRLSTIKRFIYTWFRKNRIGNIDSQTIVGSYVFCCLLSIYIIPLYILRIYDIPSFLMMIFFMVLTYIVAIPWLSKRKFKFRKQWLQMVDVFVISWFLPLIFISTLYVFLCVVDSWVNVIDKYFICCFFVSLYTTFLIYFRSLYYKHIEAVAAKDDEEKRQKELVSLRENNK